MRRWTSSRRWRCLTVRGARFTCESPGMRAGSISTSATMAGGRWRSTPRAGGSSSGRRLFYRPRGSQPLPEPEAGGSLEELRGFLNVDDYGWTLVRGFLVAALRPGLPCPILMTKGEQGAGKSTACQLTSRLIDPRTSALRGAPRDVRDLIAAAHNSLSIITRKSPLFII